MPIDDLDDAPVLRASRARLARLRADFYRRFAQAMDRSVVVHERHEGGTPVASWRGADGDLDHLQVRSYRMPNDRDPRRPMLLRVHVSYRYVPNPEGQPEDVAGSGWRRTAWRMEITALPRELPAFAPWVAALARIIDGREPLPIPPPPAPCHFGTRQFPASNYIWSVAAWARASEHDGTSDHWGLGEPPPMRATA